MCSFFAVVITLLSRGCKMFVPLAWALWFLRGLFSWALSALDHSIRSEHQNRAGDYLKKHTVAIQEAIMGGC